MQPPILRLRPALILMLLPFLQACGDAKESAEGASPEPIAQVLVSEASFEDATQAPQSEQAVSTESQALSVNGGEDSAAGADSSAEVQEIDPESLEPAGQVELKQYSVAWVGSGTIGGGTLSIDGENYPFKIVGLGVGGFGASSVEAKGVVYNLPARDAFAGTYGNARLGLTAGDSGGGKLWLRNSDGVVIELESEMRGLALAGGVDGLVIQWEEDDKSKIDDAMDGTEKSSVKA